MTNRIRTELEAAIAADLPDNTTQDITAADLRAACTDLNDTIFRDDAVALSDKTGRILLQKGGYLLKNFTAVGLPVIQGFQYTDSITFESSATLTKPSGIVEGELLVTIFMTDHELANPAFAISGWTKVGEAGDSLAQAHVGVFYKIATASETDVSVTWPVGQNYWMGWVLRVSPASSVDVSNFTQSSANLSTHIIPEVTTTVDDTLAFYALAFDGPNGSPFSVSGTGWAEEDDQAHNLNDFLDGCWGTRAMASAGATGDATITCSDTDGAGYCQFAIRS